MHALLRCRPYPVLTMVAASLATPALAAENGQVGSDSASEQEEIVVVGLGGEAGAPAASNRLGVPLQDMPQAVTVVTADLIRAQNADTLEEVLRNVPGLSQTSGHSGIFSNYVLRGFQLDNNASYFRDSLRFDRQAQVSLQNIEQVEVVRGPASIQYGKLVPGGFVNFVTKKPREEALHEITLYANSFGQLEGGLDSTGKLTGDGSVLYRVNAEAKRLESFRDHVDGEAYMVSPALTFRLGEATRLEVMSEHNRLRTIRDPGQAAPDGATIASILDPATGIDPEWFYGEKDAKNHVDTDSVTVRLNHRFAEGWEVRLDYGHSWFDRDMFYTFQLAPLNGQVRRRSNVSYTDQRSESMRAEIFGQFATGPVRHRLLVGADRLNRTFTETYGSVSVIPSVSLYDPRPAGNVAYDGTLTETDRSRTKDGGVYVQDQMEMGPFSLMLGLRHDWLDERIAVDELTEPFAFTSRTRSSQWNPSAGAVWRVLPEVSLYASYSRSLDANIAFDGCGRNFAPSRGTQYEGGAKGSMMRGRLSWAVSVFDLERTNALVDDPDGATDPNTGATCQIAAGKQRSTGFEVELGGQVLPGLTVQASYTRLNARISADSDPALVGLKLRNAPRNSAHLWGEYEFEGALDGLSLSLGMTYVDRRFANIGNTWVIPARTVWDAGVRYAFDDSHSIAIALKNLGDKRYVEDAINPRIINHGAPRSVSLRYTGRF